jgi:hypothetical protein
MCLMAAKKTFPTGDKAFGYQHLEDPADVGW